MVWMVTSPRPRPTNNFRILTNKNFRISENYQLAIFYFVDTSCFIGAQPLALMTANGLHCTPKNYEKIVQASHRELIISHWIVWLSWQLSCVSGCLQQANQGGRRIGQVDVKSLVWPQIWQNGQILVVVIRWQSSSSNYHSYFSQAPPAWRNKSVSKLEVRSKM